MRRADSPGDWKSERLSHSLRARGSVNKEPREGVRLGYKTAVFSANLVG